MVLAWELVSRYITLKIIFLVFYINIIYLLFFPLGGSRRNYYSVVYISGIVTFQLVIFFPTSEVGAGNNPEDLCQRSNMNEL
jgi:hypothetical protein